MSLSQPSDIESEGLSFTVKAPPYAPYNHPPSSVDIGACLTAVQCMEVTKSGMRSAGPDNTGAKHWETGQVPIASFLITYDLTGGKAVLELGCGLAGLGMIAAQLGADRVVAVDANKDVVEDARKNIMRAPKSLHEQLSKVSLREMEWSEATASDTDEKFDLVIGSELMYYSCPLSALVATIAASLRRNGLCVLAHIYRGPDLRSGLAQECRSRGMAVRVVSERSIEFGECLVLWWTSEEEAWLEQHPSWIEFETLEAAVDREEYDETSIENNLPLSF